MQRIVLSGGPGAGKTTALDELRNQGYGTGDDAARSIIRERKLAGLPPRPDARNFSKQIFDKEIAAYSSVNSSPFFFERGVVEAVSYQIEAGCISQDQANHLLGEYRYEMVFIFPPWEDIYCVDDERDHTFEHSVNVYESTLDMYRRCQYYPIEVPTGPVSTRVEFILQQIGDGEQ